MGGAVTAIVGVGVDAVSVDIIVVAVGACWVSVIGADVLTGLQATKIVIKASNVYKFDLLLITLLINILFAYGTDNHVGRPTANIYLPIISANSLPSAFITKSL